MFKTKGKLYIVILSLILLLIPFSKTVYGAKVMPESSYDFYVYDELYILDNTTKNHLISTNHDLNKKTGAQVVTAIFNSLNGKDIKTFATALFEKWEIGGKKDDNGILILFVANENEVWIEVGYGLEGILPDSRVKRIINENILPSFAEEDYKKGLISGFNEIIKYIQLEYDTEIKNDYIPGIDDDNLYDDAINRKYIIGFIILIIILDLKFFRGWLLFTILRVAFMGNGGGSSSRGGRGGGGRSGGGGAGGRW